MPIQTRYNVPVSQLTTFQNVGSVSEVITLENLDDVVAFLSQNKPFYILGKGSNLLINPAASVQTFIQISPSFSVPEVHQNTLKVSAGTPVSALMKLLQQYQLSGLEFSAGVPASVGGMVAMNFGCWGTEIADVIDRVHVCDFSGKTQWISKNDMGFAYRKSRIQSENLIVLEAVFSLKPDTADAIKQRVLSNIATRIDKQPLRGKTFGSTFKNPPGHFAGALIEQLGLKEKPVGQVMFSEKHANFMINLGEGRYEDAVALIQQTQKLARDTLGVTLETEVKFVS